MDHFSFTDRVRYSETDVHARLSIKALLDRFQDCSVFQSESLGGGPTKLDVLGFTWIFTAWQIHVYERPLLCEKVCTSTWPVNIKGRMAQREFRLNRTNGDLLAEAEVLLLPYSLDEGKAIRIPQSEESRYAEVLDKRLDLPRTRASIKAKGEGTPASPITVTDQLLDINGHVNNAHYIELARQAAGLADDLAHIEVCYHRQAKLNDTIVPVVYRSSDEDSGNCVTVALTGANKAPYAVVRMHARAHATD